MQKYLIILLWFLNIALRFTGIWFPQEGFDEGQNLQGAQLISSFFEGEFSHQIVTIYGFLGKLLSFGPYHLGNWIEASLNLHYDIPIGLILMRIFTSFLPSILTIYFTKKLAATIRQSTQYELIILTFFLFSFKHIETAHYAVNDALITFLAIATIYYFLQFKIKQTLNYLIAVGTLAALASSAKIHIGLLLIGSIGLSELISVFFTNLGNKKYQSFFQFSLKLTLIFSSAFILINLPYFLHLKLWLGEIWYHIKSYPFYYKGSFITYFYFNPAYGLGLGLLLLAALGSLVILLRKETKNWLSILLFTLAFICFLASSRGAIHRWAIPLTPFVVLLASYFIHAMQQYLNRQFKNKTASTLITSMLCLSIGFIPFSHVLKLVYNLSQTHNSYDQLNNLMAQQELLSQSAGKYHEANCLNFELVPLLAINVDELNKKGINYLIFSDFYFPKNQPNTIIHPHIAQQLRLQEWQTLRTYIENHWELYQTIEPKYYTHWSTNIANPPPFYIYKRPTN